MGKYVISESKLKQIIKEELTKLFEDFNYHSVMGKNIMGNLMALIINFKW